MWWISFYLQNTAIYFFASAILMSHAFIRRSLLNYFSAGCVHHLLLHCKKMKKKHMSRFTFGLIIYYLFNLVCFFPFKEERLKFYLSPLFTFSRFSYYSCYQVCDIPYQWKLGKGGKLK